MQEIGLAVVASMSSLHSLPVSKSQQAQVRAQGLTMALSVLQFVLIQVKEKQRASALWDSPDSHCQAGEGSFMEWCVLLHVVGISDKDGQLWELWTKPQASHRPTRTSTFYHGWLPVAPHKLPILYYPFIQNISCKYFMRQNLG